MKAFVIMPFDNEVSNAIYRHSTKPVCEEFKLEVRRADEIFTTNPILDDILSEIKEASVIIADISMKNPNVFYELGLSHLLKQTQTIMITQDKFEQVPFDIAHFRIIKYENTISGKVEFEKQLRLTLRNILHDYKLIYKNEFELIVNSLQKTDTDSTLFSLMALAQQDKPVSKDSSFEVDGHNEKFEMNSTGGSFDSFLDYASFFVLFDLIETVEQLVILTEKGKAFVEVLKEKGYVVDSFRFIENRI